MEEDSEAKYAPECMEEITSEYLLLEHIAGHRITMLEVFFHPLTYQNYKDGEHQAQVYSITLLTDRMDCFWDAAEDAVRKHLTSDTSRKEAGVLSIYWKKILDLPHLHTKFEEIVADAEARYEDEQDRIARVKERSR